MRQSLTPDAVAGKDFACAAVTSHAPPGNDVTYRSDAYNIDPGFGDPGSMTAFSTSALTQQSQPQADKSPEQVEKLPQPPPLAEQPVVYPWMRRFHTISGPIISNFSDLETFDVSVQTFFWKFQGLIAQVTRTAPPLKFRNTVFGN